MKTGNVPRHLVTRLHSLVLVGVLMIMAAVLVMPFYSAHSSSSGRISPPTVSSGERITRSESLTTAASPAWSFGLRSLMLAPPPAPVTVETFAAPNCTTPTTLFHPGETVCAHVSGATPGWQLIWSNSNFVAVQTSSITAASQNISFTLSPNATRGDWRVIVFDQIGGNVQAISRFTVTDAQNPLVDVQVQKTQNSAQTSSGAQVVYNIQVTNAGPDTATNVVLTDPVPANTTFFSFNQLTGPVFSCTNPNAGETGNTVCTVAAMVRGDVATFVATYTVGSGVTAGTTIDNTASVANDVADSNSSNDSETASVPVMVSPCVITCPSSIIQDADPGQAGAVITYATPSHTGDCGQDAVGEGGEIIPAISCSPASGSFFGVGTTPVICAAQQGGAVCTFEVTINNPGGLSISLNGANPLAVECGDDFSDPGAVATDANGQSVPVTVTFPQGFNPDAPAVGSYTLTYTATQDPNSVSTTRTVNVSDSKAPLISVNGANPYRIVQGSCLPFVDPGVSATDACAGATSVTTTISGPGGLNHVDNNVPGTYTVTYTATDGSHQATSSRTVLVGQFSQDESDQPDTANQPPTITLNGDDQITIECGTAFTDPGATAAVCGGSVPVTVSGTVDIHTPGTYTITYTATANSQTSTASRTVTVSPDNSAPTIQVLGANPMTVECHTSFTDPGATAHDACAGDFAATASGTVNPNVVGVYVITYNATDPSGFSATPVTRTVNVVDTTAPVVTAPANVVVYTGSSSTSCAVVVSDATLGTGSATDSCQGSLSVTRSGVPAGNSFPVGTTTITYSATDASNNTGTATQTVTVIDNTVPVISTNGQTPSMWPPNHKYQTFQVTNFVTGASDNCSSLGVGNVVIEKVTSDEIENGNGDGNTTNDIVIASDCKSVQLRSEREGNGDGRVYTITFKVTDASGNVGRATATVVVRRNPGEAAVNSGVQYTVNGTCP
jgi:uncharacterized repeat protein (TIGR01451 family)